MLNDLLKLVGLGGCDQWKVIGYTGRTVLSIGEGLSIVNTTVEYRVLILENSEGTRKLEPEILNRSNSYHSISDRTLISSGVDEYHQTCIKSGMSYEKLNERFEWKLVSYEKAKYTYEDFINTFIGEE